MSLSFSSTRSIKLLFGLVLIGSCGSSIEPITNLAEWARIEEDIQKKTHSRIGADDINNAALIPDAEPYTFFPWRQRIIPFDMLNGTASHNPMVRRIDTRFVGFSNTQEWTRKRMRNSRYTNGDVESAQDLADILLIPKTAQASELSLIFKQVMEGDGHNIQVLVNTNRTLPKLPMVPNEELARELSVEAEAMAYKFYDIDQPEVVQKYDALFKECKDVGQIWAALDNSSAAGSSLTFIVKGFQLIADENLCGPRRGVDSEYFQRTLFYLTMNYRDPSLKASGVVQIHLDEEGPAIIVSPEDTWETILPRFLALADHRGRLVLNIDGVIVEPTYYDAIEDFGPHVKSAIGRIGGDPIILGALDKSLIDRVIKRNMNEIKYCYAHQLNANPTLNGKIVAKFVISGDGSVSQAKTHSSTMTGGTAVQSCINERILRFQFPEPKGGGIVIVKYPFLFAPQ